MTYAKTNPAVAALRKAVADSVARGNPVIAETRACQVYTLDGIFDAQAESIGNGRSKVTSVCGTYSATVRDSVVSHKIETGQPIYFC
jgi:hypothetical protein